MAKSLPEMTDAELDAFIRKNPTFFVREAAREIARLRGRIAVLEIERRDK